MRRIVIYLSFVLLIVLGGCVSDSETTTEMTMDDLVVPDGFTFDMTHMVNVRAYGPETRTLTISEENGYVVFKSLLDAFSGFEYNILLASTVKNLTFTYGDEVQTHAVYPGQDIVVYFECGGARSRLDSDGDTVPDEEDDFPFDPEIAYEICYPPQPPDSTRCCRANWSTLAYEDLWPAEGDYDFNDVIINYEITEYLSYCSAVRHIYFDMYYSVDGAGYNNGFYIKVPFDDEGVAYVDYPDTVETREGFDYFFDDDDDGNLVLQFFEQGHSYWPDPPKYHNTEEEDGFSDPLHFYLHVALEDSLGYDPPRPMEEMPPYNPFLVINQEIEREVHLPNYPPTGRIDIVYFGQADDTSDPGMERYYVTAADLPWAMHIPDTYDHPLEKVSILTAYPQFADWVTSGGTTNEDWYDYPTTGNVFDFVDQFNDFIGYW